MSHCTLSPTTLALAAVALAALSGCTPMAERAATRFFRPAPDHAAKYDAAKLYPQGRIFPLGMFAGKGERDKPNGYTMLGPYGREENVADAREHGLTCTYTISLPMKFHSKQPLKLTPAQIREKIAEQVRKAAGNPEVAWWYLKPEELRYWRKNEIEYLQVAAQAIRDTDPLKRPVWMYDPGHRAADGLAHTVRHLDICGKGMYTNYSGMRDSRIWVRWTIEQEIEAIRRANPSAVPIAVPEMFQQSPDELLPMIPRWVRHDVYLSLVAGAKGIIVFSGWARPKFPAYQAYYDAFAACAREIGGPLGLGQVFLFGERRDDLRVRVLDGPRHVTMTFHKQTRDYPSVSFLDVAFGRARYLFVVNSANEALRMRIEGLPRTPVAVEDLFTPGSRATVAEGNFEQMLEALEVNAFRLTPARR